MTDARAGSYFTKEFARKRFKRKRRYLEKSKTNDGD